MRAEKNLAHLIHSQYFDHLYTQVVLNVFYIKQWGDRGEQNTVPQGKSLEFNKEGKKLNTVRCKSYYDRGNAVYYKNLQGFRVRENTR